MGTDRIHNAGVGGSSPAMANISLKKHWLVPLLFLFWVLQIARISQSFKPLNLL